MNSIVPRLREAELQQLTNALRSGRLREPFTALSLSRFADSVSADELAEWLRTTSDSGFRPQQIAHLLEAVHTDRTHRRAVTDSLEIVATGLAEEVVPTRDTAVVIRDLFGSATSSVLVVGFAVYQGTRVFASLAERMDANPDLEVRLCLDVQRPYGDTSTDDQVVRRFADRFRRTEWPQGTRLPEVYYLPSSLSHDAKVRASLHAKCVVVDGTTIYVGSANFTEAAQQRNVEVGVLLRSATICERIIRHFHSMRLRGHLRDLWEIT